MADRTQGTRTDGPADSPGAPAGRTSAVWIGLILSAVVLVFLLIFILQNRAPALISFLGWSGSAPTGVALLFAAMAGVLLVAIPGTVRMLQLRRAAARGRARRPSATG